MGIFPSNDLDLYLYCMIAIKKPSTLSSVRSSAEVIVLSGSSVLDRAHNSLQSSNL